MKPENLSDAIGSVNEDLIAQTQSIRKKKRKMKWIPWVAAAACIAIAVAVVRPIFSKENTQEAAVAQENMPLGKPSQPVLRNPNIGGITKRIAQAEYPQMVQFPDYDDFSDDWEAYNEAYAQWIDSRMLLRQSLEVPENEHYFDSFYQTASYEFLRESDGENVVFSPSNVYMALAMLAELTDGESRQQILDLLGTENIDDLRTEAKHLWGNNYCDDGYLTTRMANSLWLADGLPYNQETMDMIAKEYYASSFSGTMGSEEYSQLLRDWLNEQTGNLLKEDVEELGFDPQTVMALASTIYLKGRWTETFGKADTRPEIFHGAKGDTTTDFMHASSMGDVYWAESYRAITKPMENGASMWLILPDEDKSVEDVFAEGEIFEMTAGLPTWEQRKSVQVNLAMPKFDVRSNIDLIEGLENLGVTDVFDHMVSDFTPMSEELENVYISKAEHAARVMVDEEGCEAAAYTVMMMECGEAICEDEIDFVLDRPFIFVISGCGSQPLFIGVVNQA